MPKAISMTVDELKEFKKTGVWPDEGRAAKDDRPAHQRPQTGVMNQTEARWAGDLEGLRLAGEIRCWQYEPLKLRLAKGTYYSPDFLVVYPDGSMQFHEVKGFWRDDARIKVKVAAEKFPMFKFVAVTRKRGGWEIERF